jgi:hypothetical protein
LLLAPGRSAPICPASENLTLVKLQNGYIHTDSILYDWLVYFWQAALVFFRCPAYLEIMMIIEREISRAKNEASIGDLRFTNGFGLYA